MSFLSIKKKFRYRNKLPNVAILVESLDKGGLEQVVFNLASNFQNVNPYILIKGKKYGFNGWKLLQKGYKVFFFNENSEMFLNFLKEKNIKVVNAHYFIWNLKEMKDMGIKIVYTIHNSYTWVDKKEEIKVRKEAYLNVDKFIAVSNSVKRYFVDKFDIKEDKVKVVMNGLNIKELKPRLKSMNSSEKDKFVFLNVGSFTPVKNQILMLSAFKEVFKDKKNILLWFVGHSFNDDYYKRIHEIITEYGLASSVKIFDFVAKKDLACLYKKSRCFLLPSTQEGCSNVLLEAMYFGTPVIASDVGSAKELIKDYGILINNSYEDILKENAESLYGGHSIAMSMNQKNKGELIEAMTDIIDNYDSWKEKALERSQYIKKECNVQKMVEEYESIINALIP